MKEINTARRKGEAFPHCAAAKPRWFIEWQVGANTTVMIKPRINADDTDQNSF